MKNLFRFCTILFFFAVSFSYQAEACPTTELQISGNLDRRAPLNGIPENPTFATLDTAAEFSLSAGVFDSFGDSHPVKIYFFHVSTESNTDTWTAAGFVDGSELAGGASGDAVKISDIATISVGHGFNDVSSFSANWSNGVSQTWGVQYTNFSSLNVESNISSIVQNGSDGECKRLCNNSADVDGDGRDDIAVWRPQYGMWAILKSGTNNSAFVWKQWGLPDDYPLNGDYTGDGKMDLVVWRPLNGNWYVCSSETEFDCSKGTVTQFGLPGDRPIKGDFDGDGTLDFAVWRTAYGLFIYKASSTGEVVVKQWGLPGDIPTGTGSNQ